MSHGRLTRGARRVAFATLLAFAVAVPSAEAAPQPRHVEAPDADRCDFLDQAVCLHPWPSDFFTVPDAGTDSGRRVNLDLRSMPRNSAGKPIDPADQNRADGFSPGNLIVTRVPGLDNPQAFRRTGAVGLADIARYADRDQPVVVINAGTGRRHPVWSEIDANPQDPANVNLIIRPAVNFEEGARYIVALRNLRRADGSPIEPAPVFDAYRDGAPTDNADVEARRPHMEQLFATLKRAGVNPKQLYLAWDFTVASERSLSERMLAIRDGAFAGLGDGNLADLQVQGAAPGFLVDKVVDDPDGPGDTRIARRVEGRVTVPCYLNLLGCPSGSTFLLGSDGRPTRLPGNTTEARFTCSIPRAAMTSGQAARPSLYGHGLLGSRAEIGQGQLKDFGAEHNMMFCATDWIGMACADTPFGPDDAQGVLEEIAAGRSPSTPNCDIPTVLAILNDLSNFNKLADRVQQGMLNFLFLGRAMVHPQGFASHDAFQRGDGSSVIDTARLFYDGNSQGGIIGGALAAVGVDHDRAVLGVPGMNYSTLLRRSVDFDAYATGKLDSSLPDTPLGLYDNYPNELERPLIISLIQMLWDRAEANGYAHHMTGDPLPNTPPHHVLLHPAFGDHQVANVAAEVEARTIGARARTPYVDPRRTPYSTTTPWGIPAITGFPFAGSAIVMWDSGPIRDGGAKGTATPPLENVPPKAGNDPHEFPRRVQAARAQKSEFLKVGGRVVDVCGPAPCFSDGWDGQAGF